MRKRENLKRDHINALEEVVSKAFEEKGEQWDRDEELQRAMREQEDSSDSESEEVIVDDIEDDDSGNESFLYLLIIIRNARGEVF
jgi:hypothetical protein